MSSSSSSSDADQEVGEAAEGLIEYVHVAEPDLEAAVMEEYVSSNEYERGRRPSSSSHSSSSSSSSSHGHIHAIHTTPILVPLMEPVFLVPEPEPTTVVNIVTISTTNTVSTNHVQTVYVESGPGGDTASTSSSSSSSDSDRGHGKKNKKTKKEHKEGKRKAPAPPVALMSPVSPVVVEPQSFGFINPEPQVVLLPQAEPEVSTPPTRSGGCCGCFK